MPRSSLRSSAPQRLDAVGDGDGGVAGISRVGSGVGACLGLLGLGGRVECGACGSVGCGCGCGCGDGDGDAVAGFGVVAVFYRFTAFGQPPQGGVFAVPRGRFRGALAVGFVFERVDPRRR